MSEVPSSAGNVPNEQYPSEPVLIHEPPESAIEESSQSVDREVVAEQSASESPVTDESQPPPVETEPPLGQADSNPSKPRSRIRLLGVAILLGALLVVLSAWMLVRTAELAQNTHELASAPRPVTVVKAAPSSFRKSHRYVATLKPWVSARIGPQLVSAYVHDVYFLPGATVKKGEILATLDCRTSEAQEQAIALARKSLEAKQIALNEQAKRLQSLVDGGFVSVNEADLKSAEGVSAQAEAAAQNARLMGASLEVSDCVLRAPFDGEVVERFLDPGGFARPGLPILTLIDRTTVRLAMDVPENDNIVVAPGSVLSARIPSVDRTIEAKISRRVASADPITRTIHVESDMPNADRTIPVETTADVGVEYGDSVSAAAIPVSAATVRGGRATIFAIEGNIARKRTLDVLQETEGWLFVPPDQVGTLLVVEGRSLLHDGDKVDATLGGAQ